MDPRKQFKAMKTGAKKRLGAAVDAIVPQGKDKKGKGKHSNYNNMQSSEADEQTTNSWDDGQTLNSQEMEEALNRLKFEVQKKQGALLANTSTENNLNTFADTPDISPSYSIPHTALNNHFTPNNRNFTPCPPPSDMPPPFIDPLTLSTSSDPQFSYTQIPLPPPLPSTLNKRNNTSTTSTSVTSESTSITKPTQSTSSNNLIQNELLAAIAKRRKELKEQEKAATTTPSSIVHFTQTETQHYIKTDTNPTELRNSTRKPISDIRDVSLDEPSINSTEEFAIVILEETMETIPPYEDKHRSIPTNTAMPVKPATLNATQPPASKSAAKSSFSLFCCCQAEDDDECTLLTNNSVQFRK